MLLLRQVSPHPAVDSDNWSTAWFFHFSGSRVTQVTVNHIGNELPNAHDELSDKSSSLTLLALVGVGSSSMMLELD